MTHSNIKPKRRPNPKSCFRQHLFHLLIQTMPLLVMSLLLLLAPAARGASESGYFLIRSEQGLVDQFPLLTTEVDAEISGFLARVKVRQVYTNTGELPLEAQYVFPSADNAAVHQMKMIIGDRVLQADIMEKQQARQTYETAKTEGKTTSLLEQNEPGLLKMNVANILPGDLIEVELTYTEQLVPRDGYYEFVYPAQRRPSVLGSGNEMPELVHTASESGFDISVHLNPGLPLQKLESLNHEVQIESVTAQSKMVLLEQPEINARATPTQSDFRLRYSLLDNDISSGLLSYREGDDLWFLLMAEPPNQYNKTAILPREYILIVDYSGSMAGLPLDTARYMTSQLLSELTPEDRFNIVLFAGASDQLARQSLEPTPENIKRAQGFLESRGAGGGTDLLSAIKRSESIPQTSGFTRTLLIVSDGGIAVPIETQQHIRAQLSDTNVFAYAIGSYADNPAMHALATAGQGELVSILDDKDVDSRTSNFLEYIRAPLLTDIEVEFSHGLSAHVDLQPAGLPDLFSQRPVFVTGHISLPATMGQDDPVISLVGTTADGPYQMQFPLLANASDQHRAVRTVWARQKADHLLREMSLSSQDQDQYREAIVELGLANCLLTRFTSFVAVDRIVRAPQTGSAEVDLTRKSSPAQVPVGSAGFSLSGPAIYLTASRQIVSLENLIAGEASQQVHEASVLTSEVRESRQNITFILGKDRDDSNNRYYNHATDWFLSQPDSGEVIVHLRSLVEMRDWLATRHYDLSPWGTINLVVHASPWTRMHLNLDASDQGSSFHDIAAFLDLDNAALADSVVDQNTTLRVYACGLGQQRELLDLLSRFLGGHDNKRPVVESPRAFVVFGRDSDTGRSQAWLLPVEWRWLPEGSTQSIDHRRYPQSTPVNLVQAIESDVVSEIPHPAILALRLPQIESQLNRLKARVSDFRWQYQQSGHGAAELIGSADLFYSATDITSAAIVHRLLSFDVSDREKMTRVEPNSE